MFCLGYYSYKLIKEKMKNKFSILATALMMLAFGESVQAAVLTFEELPHEYELQGVGNTVFSKRFVLQYAPAPGEPYPVGFTSVGAIWQFNGRSTALTANSCSATTTLTAEDNSPITLVSIDLAELNGDADVSVAFEGVTAEGSVVRKNVKLKERRTWQTVEFPATFRNLRFVRWTQGDCLKNPPHMFDNIRVHPTWKGQQD
jgi:hypothetical protein